MFDKELLNLLNNELIKNSRDCWMRQSLSSTAISTILPNEHLEEIPLQELITAFNAQTRKPYDGLFLKDRLVAVVGDSNSANNLAHSFFSARPTLELGQGQDQITLDPSVSSVSLSSRQSTNAATTSSVQNLEFSSQLGNLESITTRLSSSAGDISLLLQASPFIIFSCQATLSSFFNFYEFLLCFAEKNSFSEQESLFLSGELMRCLNLAGAVAAKFKETDLNFEKLLSEKSLLEEEFHSLLSRLFQLRNPLLGGPGELFFFFFGNYLTILQEKRKLDYVLLGFSRAHFEFYFFFEYFSFLSKLKNNVPVVPLAELLFFNFGLTIVRKYLSKFLDLFEKVCLFREELKFLSKFLKDIEIATSLPEKAVLFLGEKKAAYGKFITFGQEVFHTIAARAVSLQAEESLLKKGENLLPLLIELLSPKISDKVVVPQLKYFFIDLFSVSINYLEGKVDKDVTAQLSTSSSFFQELHVAFTLLLQKKETNRKVLSLFLDKLRFFPLYPEEIRRFTFLLKNYLKNHYIFEISGSCNRTGLEYNAKNFFSRFLLDLGLPAGVTRQLFDKFFGRILPENFYSSVSFSNRLRALQSSSSGNWTGSLLLHQQEEGGKKEVEELSFTEGFPWGETLLQHIPFCFRGAEQTMSAPISLLRIELPAAKEALSLLKSIQRYMLLDVSQSNYVMVSKELLTWQLNSIASSILHLENSINLAISVLSNHNVEERFKADFFSFPSVTDQSIVFFSEDWLTKVYKQKNLNVLRSLLTSVIWSIHQKKARKIYEYFYLRNQATTHPINETLLQNNAMLLVLYDNLFKKFFLVFKEQWWFFFESKLAFVLDAVQLLSGNKNKLFSLFKTFILKKNELLFKFQKQLLQLEKTVSYAYATTSTKYENVAILSDKEQRLLLLDLLAVSDSFFSICAFVGDISFLLQNILIHYAISVNINDFKTKEKKNEFVNSVFKFWSNSNISFEPENSQIEKQASLLKHCTSISDKDYSSTWSDLRSPVSVFELFIFSELLFCRNSLVVTQVNFMFQKIFIFFSHYCNSVKNYVSLPNRKISYVLKQFSETAIYADEVEFKDKSVVSYPSIYLSQRSADSSFPTEVIKPGVFTRLEEKKQENISSYSDLMKNLVQLRLQQEKIEFFFFKNLKKKNITISRNTLYHKFSQDSIIFSLTKRLARSQQQYISVINLLNSLKDQRVDRDFVLEDDLKAQSVTLLNHILNLYIRIKTRKIGLLLMYQKSIFQLFDARRKKSLLHNLQKLKNLWKSKKKNPLYSFMRKKSKNKLKKNWFSSIQKKVRERVKLSQTRSCAQLAKKLYNNKEFWSKERERLLEEKKITFDNIMKYRLGDGWLGLEEEYVAPLTEPLTYQNILNYGSSYDLTPKTMKRIKISIGINNKLDLLDKKADKLGELAYSEYHRIKNYFLDIKDIKYELFILGLKSKLFFWKNYQPMIEELHRDLETTYKTVNKHLVLESKLKKARLEVLNEYNNLYKFYREAVSVYVKKLMSGEIETDISRLERASNKAIRLYWASSSEKKKKINLRSFILKEKKLFINKFSSNLSNYSLKDSKNVLIRFPGQLPNIFAKYQLLPRNLFFKQSVYLDKKLAKYNIFPNLKELNNVLFEKQSGQLYSLSFIKKFIDKHNATLHQKKKMLSFLNQKFNLKFSKLSKLFNKKSVHRFVEHLSSDHIKEIVTVFQNFSKFNLEKKTIREYISKLDIKKNKIIFKRFISKFLEYKRKLSKERRSPSLDAAALKKISRRTTMLRIFIICYQTLIQLKEWLIDLLERYLTLLELQLIYGDSIRNIDFESFFLFLNPHIKQLKVYVSIFEELSKEGATKLSKNVSFLFYLHFATQFIKKKSKRFSRLSEDFSGISKDFLSPGELQFCSKRREAILKEYTTFFKKDLHNFFLKKKIYYSYLALLNQKKNVFSKNKIKESLIPSGLKNTSYFFINKDKFLPFMNSIHQFSSYINFFKKKLYKLESAEKKTLALTLYENKKNAAVSSVLEELISNSTAIGSKLMEKLGEEVTSSILEEVLDSDLQKIINDSFEEEKFFNLRIEECADELLDEVFDELLAPTLENVLTVLRSLLTVQRQEAAINVISFSLIEEVLHNELVSILKEVIAEEVERKRRLEEIEREERLLDLKSVMVFYDILEEVLDEELPPLFEPHRTLMRVVRRFIRRNHNTFLKRPTDARRFQYELFVSLFNFVIFFSLKFFPTLWQMHRNAKVRRLSLVKEFYQKGFANEKMMKNLMVAFLNHDENYLTFCSAMAKGDWFYPVLASTCWFLLSEPVFARLIYFFFEEMKYFNKLFLINKRFRLSAGAYLDHDVIKSRFFFRRSRTELRYLAAETGWVASLNEKLFRNLERQNYRLFTKNLLNHMLLVDHIPLTELMFYPERRGVSMGERARQDVLSFIKHSFTGILRALATTELEEAEEWSQQKFNYFQIFGNGKGRVLNLQKNLIKFTVALRKARILANPKNSVKKRQEFRCFLNSLRPDAFSKSGYDTRKYFRLQTLSRHSRSYPRNFPVYNIPRITGSPDSIEYQAIRSAHIPLQILGAPRDFWESTTPKNHIRNQRLFKKLIAEAKPTVQLMEFLLQYRDLINSMTSVNAASTIKLSFIETSVKLLSILTRGTQKYNTLLPILNVLKNREEEYSLFLSFANTGLSPRLFSLNLNFIDTFIKWTDTQTTNSSWVNLYSSFYALHGGFVARKEFYKRISDYEFLHKKYFWNIGNGTNPNKLFFLFELEMSKYLSIVKAYYDVLCFNFKFLNHVLTFFSDSLFLEDNQKFFEGLIASCRLTVIETLLSLYYLEDFQVQFYFQSRRLLPEVFDQIKKFTELYQQLVPKFVYNFLKQEKFNYNRELMQSYCNTMEFPLHNNLGKFVNQNMLSALKSFRALKFSERQFFSSFTKNFFNSLATVFQKKSHNIKKIFFNKPYTRRMLRLNSFSLDNHFLQQLQSVIDQLKKKELAPLLNAHDNKFLVDAGLKLKYSYYGPNHYFMPPNHIKCDDVAELIQKFRQEVSSFLLPGLNKAVYRHFFPKKKLRDLSFHLLKTYILILHNVRQQKFPEDPIFSLYKHTIYSYVYNATPFRIFQRKSKLLEEFKKNFVKNLSFTLFSSIKREVFKRREKAALDPARWVFNYYLNNFFNEGFCAVEAVKSIRTFRKILFESFRQLIRLFDKNLALFSSEKKHKLFLDLHNILFDHRKLKEKVFLDLSIQQKDKFIKAFFSNKDIPIELLPNFTYKQSFTKDKNPFFENPRSTLKAFKVVLLSKKKLINFIKFTNILYINLKQNKILYEKFLSEYLKRTFSSYLFFKMRFGKSKRKFKTYLKSRTKHTHNLLLLKRLLGSLDKELKLFSKKLIDCSFSLNAAFLKLSQEEFGPNKSPNWNFLDFLKQHGVGTLGESAFLLIKSDFEKFHSSLLDLVLQRLTAKLNKKVYKKVILYNYEIATYREKQIARLRRELNVLSDLYRYYLSYATTQIPNEVVTKFLNPRIERFKKPYIYNRPEFWTIEKSIVDTFGTPTDERNIVSEPLKLAFRKLLQFVAPHQEKKLANTFGYPLFLYPKSSHTDEHVLRYNREIVPIYKKFLGKPSIESLWESQKRSKKETQAFSFFFKKFYNSKPWYHWKSSVTDFLNNFHNRWKKKLFPQGKAKALLVRRPENFYIISLADLKPFFMDDPELGMLHLNLWDDPIKNLLKYKDVKVFLPHWRKLFLPKKEVNESVLLGTTRHFQNLCKTFLGFQPPRTLSFDVPNIKKEVIHFGPTVSAKNSKFFFQDLLHKIEKSPYNNNNNQDQRLLEIFHSIYQKSHKNTFNESTVNKLYKNLRANYQNRKLLKNKIFDYDFSDVPLTYQFFRNNLRKKKKIKLSRVHAKIKRKLLKKEFIDSSFANHLTAKVVPQAESLSKLLSLENETFNKQQMFPITTAFKRIFNEKKRAKYLSAFSNSRSSRFSNYENFLVRNKLLLSLYIYLKKRNKFFFKWTDDSINSAVPDSAFLAELLRKQLKFYKVNNKKIFLFLKKKYFVTRHEKKKYLARRKGRFLFNWRPFLREKFVQHILLKNRKKPKIKKKMLRFFFKKLKRLKKDLKKSARSVDEKLFSPNGLPIITIDLNKKKMIDSSTIKKKKKKKKKVKKKTKTKLKTIKKKKKEKAKTELKTIKKKKKVKEKIEPKTIKKKEKAKTELKTIKKKKKVKEKAKTEPKTIKKKKKVKSKLKKKKISQKKKVKKKTKSAKPKSKKKISKKKKKKTKVAKKKKKLLSSITWKKRNYDLNLKKIWLYQYKNKKRNKKQKKKKGTNPNIGGAIAVKQQEQKKKQKKKKLSFFLRRLSFTPKANRKIKKYWVRQGVLPLKKKRKKKTTKVIKSRVNFFFQLLTSYAPKKQNWLLAFIGQIVDLKKKKKQQAIAKKKKEAAAAKKKQQALAAAIAAKKKKRQATVAALAEARKKQQALLAAYKNKKKEQQPVATAPKTIASHPKTAVMKKKKVALKKKVLKKSLKKPLKKIKRPRIAKLTDLPSLYSRLALRQKKLRRRERRRKKKKALRLARKKRRLARQERRRLEAKTLGKKKKKKKKKAKKKKELTLRETIKLANMPIEAVERSLGMDPHTIDKLDAERAERAKRKPKTKKQKELLQRIKQLHRWFLKLRRKVFRTLKIKYFSRKKKEKPRYIVSANYAAAKKKEKSVIIKSKNLGKKKEKIKNKLKKNKNVKKKKQQPSRRLAVSKPDPDAAKIIAALQENLGTKLTADASKKQQKRKKKKRRSSKKNLKTTINRFSFSHWRLLTKKIKKTKQEKLLLFKKQKLLKNCNRKLAKRRINFLKLRKILRKVSKFFNKKSAKLFFSPVILSVSPSKFSNKKRLLTSSYLTPHILSQDWDLLNRNFLHSTSFVSKNTELQPVKKPFFSFLNNVPFFYLKKPTFLLFSDFLHQRLKSLVVERPLDNKNFIKRNFFFNLQRKGKKKLLNKLANPGNIKNKLFFKRLVNKSFLHNANNLSEYFWKPYLSKKFLQLSKQKLTLSQYLQKVEHLFDQEKIVSLTNLFLLPKKDQIPILRFFATRFKEAQLSSALLRKAERLLFSQKISNFIKEKKLRKEFSNFKTRMEVTINKEVFFEILQTMDVYVQILYKYYYVIQAFAPEAKKLPEFVAKILSDCSTEFVKYLQMLKAWIAHCATTKELCDFDFTLLEEKVKLDPIFLKSQIKHLSRAIMVPMLYRDKNRFVWDYRTDRLFLSKFRKRNSELIANFRDGLLNAKLFDSYIAKIFSTRIEKYNQILAAVDLLLSQLSEGIFLYSAVEGWTDAHLFFEEFADNVWSAYCYKKLKKKLKVSCNQRFTQLATLHKWCGMVKTLKGPQEKLLSHLYKTGFFSKIHFKHNPYLIPKLSLPPQIKLPKAALPLWLISKNYFFSKKILEKTLLAFHRSYRRVNNHFYILSLELVKEIFSFCFKYKLDDSFIPFLFSLTEWNAKQLPLFILQNAARKNFNFFLKNLSKIIFLNRRYQKFYINLEKKKNQFFSSVYAAICFHEKSKKNYYKWFPPVTKKKKKFDVGSGFDPDVEDYYNEAYFGGENPFQLFKFYQVADESFARKISQLKRSFRRNKGLTFVKSNAVKRLKKKVKWYPRLFKENFLISFIRKVTDIFRLHPNLNPWTYHQKEMYGLFVFYHNQVIHNIAEIVEKNKSARLLLERFSDYFDYREALTTATFFSSDKDKSTASLISQTLKNKKKPDYSRNSFYKILRYITIPESYRKEIKKLDHFLVLLSKKAKRKTDIHSKKLFSTIYDEPIADMIINLETQVFNYVRAQFDKNVCMIEPGAISSFRSQNELFKEFLMAFIFLRFQLNTIKLVSDIYTNKKSFNDYFKKKKVQKNTKLYYRKHLNGLQYRTKLKKFNVKRSAQRKAFKKRLRILMDQVLNVPLKHNLLYAEDTNFLILKKYLCNEVFVLLKRSNAKVMKNLLKRLVTVNVIREGTITKKVYRHRLTYLKRIRWLYNFLLKLNAFEHTLSLHWRNLDNFHPHFSVIEEFYTELLDKARLSLKSVKKKTINHSLPVRKSGRLASAKLLEKKSKYAFEFDNYLNLKDTLDKLCYKKKSLFTQRKKAKFFNLSKKKLWKVWQQRFTHKTRKRQFKKKQGRWNKYYKYSSNQRRVGRKKKSYFWTHWLLSRCKNMLNFSFKFSRPYEFTLISLLWKRFKTYIWFERIKEEIAKQRYNKGPLTTDFSDLKFNEEDLVNYLQNDKFGSNEELDTFFDHIYGKNVKNSSSNDLYLPDIDVDIEWLVNQINEFISNNYGRAAPFLFNLLFTSLATYFVGTDFVYINWYDLLMNDLFGFIYSRLFNEDFFIY